MLRRPSSRVVCIPNPPTEPVASPPLPWQRGILEAAATPADLTDREWQVIVLITHGLSNDEIADRLCLGLNTVKTYIRAVYRQIGCRTRSQAAVWGCVHGLLSADGGPAGAADRRAHPTPPSARPA